MNKELFDALDLLEKEKGLPKDYMIEKIETALVSAVKKQYGANADMRAVLDPEKLDYKVFLRRTVVEGPVEEENKGYEVSAAEVNANRKTRLYQVGDICETELKTKEFRRLSATAAKSVIVQAIREGERKLQQEAYEKKREEIITAVVLKVDPETGNAVLDTGTGHATLLLSEQIPGETYTVGQEIKVFVTEVNKEARGPLVQLSRIHPSLVRRLFELQIPEIAEGTVVIKSIAREAGSHTKIAVASMDESVDPVGSCIGPNHERRDAVARELGGERIDIIRYSDVPEEFVAAALQPATVLSVTMTADNACHVVVDPDHQSLAIGKAGQNVRLAARLTHVKIDIKTE